MRVIELLKSQWKISNLTICLFGALLGLAAGLFELRDFIFSPGLVEISDLRWPYSSDIYPMHYLWDESGQVPIIINHMLLRLGFYLLPPEAGERLLFIFLYMLMGMSMFFVTFKLTAKHCTTHTVPLVASTLATLFFVANPLIALRLHIRAFMLFYALLPLLVYFSYTAFNNLASLNKSEILKKAIYIALILLAMSPSARMVYYFPFIFFGFFAAFSRPNWEYLRRSSMLVGLTLALYVLLSAVWLLPIALGSSSSPGYVFTSDQLRSASGASGLLDMATLTATGIGRPQLLESTFFIEGWLSHVWRSAIYILPILAFSSVVLRRNKLTIWLAIFALALIFLGKGTNAPFAGLYPWLVFDAPALSFFGWQFRVPHRWDIPLAFCYALMTGLTIAYALGWMKERINRIKLRKAVFGTSIFILAMIPLIASYPLLTGDVSGRMKPEELSSDEVAFNRWLEEENSDFTVMFYPKPPLWGCPKPYTNLKPPSSVRQHLDYWIFINDSLSEFDTIRFGELLAPLNVKYLVVRTDLLNNKQEVEVSSALLAQEDIGQIKQFGHLLVYENRAYTPRISVAAQSTATLGGFGLMLALASLDHYNGTASSIFFIDQSVRSTDYLSGADTLVSNQGNRDFYFSLLKDEHLINPFAATNRRAPLERWSKGRTNDPTGGVWHPILEELGLENWQLDYGKGLVFTWAPDTLDMSFGVDETGKHDLFVRYFQNEEGGKVRIWLDGQRVEEIETESHVNEFVWKKIGSFDLRKGRHKLELENIDGFNAVNLIAALPSGELERLEEKGHDLVEGKRLVYVWEAESSLYYTEAQVSEQPSRQASSGAVLQLPAGSTAWRDMDVLKAGEYMIAVKLDGSASVSIANQDFQVNSTEFEFTYLGPIYLNEDAHRLAISTASGEAAALDVVWLYSAGEENETLEEVFKVVEPPATLISYQKINPTKYKVRTNASQPFMLSFSGTYNPLWVAKVNGKEYSSLPLYSVVNGFWIAETGELEISIEYKPQNWFYYGAIISVVSLFGLLAYLLWDWRRKRRSKDINQG